MSKKDKPPIDERAVFETIFGEPPSKSGSMDIVKSVDIKSDTKSEDILDDDHDVPEYIKNNTLKINEMDILKILKSKARGLNDVEYNEEFEKNRKEIMEKRVQIYYDSKGLLSTEDNEILSSLNDDRSDNEVLSDMIKEKWDAETKF